MDAFLPRERLPDLFRVLADTGYRTLAPRLHQGAIQFAETDSLAGLQGLQVEMAPGHYRVTRSDEPYCFSWAVGPEAIKPLTFCATERLWSATAAGLAFSPIEPDMAKTALIGVRACDLAALALQKQHFLEASHTDDWFRQRAESLLLVAVECRVSAATCFCHSTGDGPAVHQNHDICLHELRDGFLIQHGSAQGKAVLEQLPVIPATQAHRDSRQQQLEAAAGQQLRSIPSGDLTASLRAHWEAPAWQAIAERCLSCGNCTIVCPTCFCHRQHDRPGEEPGSREQVREWDSCFTEQHSYIHGIVIRKETKSRYRQWLSHKLGFWYEQYGRSGCVGCGRCITWCPVGIDITAAVQQVLEAGAC